MDGTNIVDSLISGGILLILGGMLAALFKVNTNLARLNVQQDNLKERLDRLEGNKGRASSALLGLLMFLAVFASGCQLLGLDMEQAQADVEETASALEIVKTRLPAMEASVEQLTALHDAAIKNKDYDEAARIWPKLQSSLKSLELTEAEKSQLKNNFEKQVSAFTSAKDIRGYLQAALGLFGGVFATFMGGRRMLKRRDKIIQTTANNIELADGKLFKLKMLQREKLDAKEQALLSKLRKA